MDQYLLIEPSSDDHREVGVSLGSSASFPKCLHLAIAALLQNEKIIYYKCIQYLCLHEKTTTTTKHATSQFVKHAALHIPIGHRFKMKIKRVELLKWWQCTFTMLRLCTLTLESEANMNTELGLYTGTCQTTNYKSSSNIFQAMHSRARLLHSAGKIVNN